MKLKSYLGPPLITLVLLFIIEAICSIFTENNMPFLWNMSMNSIVAPQVIDPQYGFNEVDPLLGYSRTEELQNSLGFKIENGCTVLANSADTNYKVNILITGGSTSDLGIDSSNWPVELQKVLTKHGINARIYNGAVGGYNSGQEFLKLIRDGLNTKPVIHISYSGANDYDTQSYVCSYENLFYENEFRTSRYSLLMPRMMLLLRTWINRNNSKVYLRRLESMKGAYFWEKNMRLMHATALEYNYHFVGILQPVMGGSTSYQQVVPNHDKTIKEYRERYPLMKELVQKHPEFISDLSGIFTSAGARYSKITAIYMPNTSIW